MTDGDRLLDVVGLLLVLGFVAGVVLLVLIGMGGGPDRPEEPPVTNWHAERVNETHVRIIHAGGDPVETGDLLVTVDGSERAVSWSRTVFEGDAGVVRAREGATVELYWQPDRRSDRELLRSWEP